MGGSDTGERDRVKFQESIRELDQGVAASLQCVQVQYNAWGEGECRAQLHEGGRGRELEVTRVEKDVGVMVEDTLKPSMQCAAAAAKACAGVCRDSVVP